MDSFSTHAGFVKSVTRDTRLRISRCFPLIAEQIWHFGEHFPLCFLDILNPLQLFAIN
jgi:hypothetical protein